MTLRSRGIGCSANQKSYLARWHYGQRYLLADIDEDFPALDALQFQNAAYEPRVVL